MGTDIHTFVEVKELVDGLQDRWVYQPSIQPFNWRSYGMYGFLANVRNYSYVPSISSQRGTPPDFTVPEDEWYYYHSVTWVDLAELVIFDYNSGFEDRRTMKEVSPGHFDGSACTIEGHGKLVSFYDFLGDDYFRDLEMLKRLSFASKMAPVRITMGFDS